LSPDTFDFTNLVNQSLSTAVETNEITIAGVNTGVTVSVNT
jgi:hypothetical protein